jgi:hypothetical protein
LYALWTEGAHGHQLPRAKTGNCESIPHKSNCYNFGPNIKVESKKL